VVTGTHLQHGGGERCVQGFGGKTLRERDHWGGTSIDWRIILRQIFKMWDVGMDWIGLAQDRDRWGHL
jgi:hypothetical protein